MSLRVGAGLSGARDPVVAAIDACRDAADTLEGQAPHLVVTFVSGSHLELPGTVLEVVQGALEPECLIGCCAGGVLGGGRELERGNAVAVWAARLPEGGIVHPFRVPAGVPLLPEELGDIKDPRGILLLADGERLAVEPLLNELWELAPGAPIVGGLASARSRDGHTLLLGSEPVDEGAIGVVLEGVEMLACVSQGAVPLGPEMTITRAEGNMICELAGRPAREAVEHALGELTQRERSLVAGGLLVGIVIDAGKPDYEQGDFLVRGILGLDRASGGIAVAAPVREGQVVRLHARDAISADEDLLRALKLQRTATAGALAGSLVFSCNGRGSNLFGMGDHDAAAVHRELGGAPSAGFFAAGEIGPVAGRSFLHSFTATMAVFPQ